MTKFAKKKKERLAEIASIIEAVDQRCQAADGPVTPTLKEMTQEEISRIYALAKNDTTFLKALRNDDLGLPTDGSPIGVAQRFG